MIDSIVSFTVYDNPLLWLETIKLLSISYDLVSSNLNIVQVLGFRITYVGLYDLSSLFGPLVSGISVVVRPSRTHPCREG